MNKLKLITAAAMLTTVIPSSNAMMNMSGLPVQMKAMFKSCGFQDTSSAEYKAKKAKQQLEHAQDRAYGEVIEIPISDKRNFCFSVTFSGLFDLQELFLIRQIQLCKTFLNHSL